MYMFGPVFNAFFSRLNPGYGVRSKILYAVRDPIHCELNAPRYVSVGLMWSHDLCVHCQSTLMPLLVRRAYHEHVGHVLHGDTKIRLGPIAPSLIEGS